MATPDYEFHAITNATTGELLALLTLKIAAKSVTANLTINNNKVSYRSGGIGHNRYRAAIAGVAHNFMGKFANDEYWAVNDEQKRILDILVVESSHQLENLANHGFRFETAF